MFVLVGVGEENKIVSKKKYDLKPSVRSFIRARTVWEKKYKRYVTMWLLDFETNKAYLIGPSSNTICGWRTMTENEKQLVNR